LKKKSQKELVEWLKVKTLSSSPNVTKNNNYIYICIYTYICANPKTLTSVSSFDTHFHS
jgi:hypothetical protein